MVAEIIFSNEYKKVYKDAFKTASRWQGIVNFYSVDCCKEINSGLCAHHGSSQTPRIKVCLFLFYLCWFAILVFQNRQSSKELGRENYHLHQWNKLAYPNCSAHYCRRWRGVMWKLSESQAVAEWVGFLKVEWFLT